jgi:phosphate-selective porin OprO/OprP
VITLEVTASRSRAEGDIDYRQVNEKTAQMSVPATAFDFVLAENRAANISPSADDTSVKKGEPIVVSPPPEGAYPTYRITGFTQLDGAWYDQSTLNAAQVGDAQNGVGFRRARVGIVGRVAEFGGYMLEMDFATAGHPSFFDVWYEQENLPVVDTLRIGQYCQPFSVDALTGFRNLTFLERSLPFLAFVPFRRVGIMAYGGSENELTHWAISGFRTGGFNNAPLGDNRYATDIGDVGGYSLSTRVTHLLYYDDASDGRYLCHIGGSYDYSRLGANTAPGSTSSVPFYQAKTTPEFGPLGNSEVAQPFGQAYAATPVFVDSGKFAANAFNLFGVESLLQWGAWGVTSEWMGTLVDGTSVGSVFYHGAYVQAAYRITGEQREYDKQTGALGKLTPFSDFFSLSRGRSGIHGSGAWEVAARWSYVDVRNPTNMTYLSGNGFGNGTLHDVTFGLTWFLNVHTKLQFNWIHAMLDNAGYPATPTPGVQATSGDSTADLFVTRFQVDF